MTQALKTSPLSAPQWKLIEKLLSDFDSRQIAWVSGYLAAQDAKPSAQEPSVAPVLIAHGGETGNSRQIALSSAESARMAGIPVEVVNLATTKVRQLRKYEWLLIVCSTHGNGDPPEPIEAFFEALMSDSAPTLSNLQFAVLALGDSSYDQFCVTGQQIDRRLESLGATRLHPRVECDVDFAVPAAAWEAAVLKKLPRTGASDALPTKQEIVATTTVYDKQHPLSVEVLENRRLSNANRRSAIHHIELEMPEGALALSPGDAVGILVDNPPDLVAAILDAIQLSAEACVSVGDRPMTLVEALRQQVDVTIPGAQFLSYWAELSGSETLRAFTDAPIREQRQFLKTVQIRDLVTAYPAVPGAQAFLDALRPLQPRLYDVANEIDGQTDELHLTVKHFHYNFQARTESGIASRYLLALEPGDPVRLYAHTNNRFHLPEEADIPVILIGEGTGIAPYRAFVESNAHRETPRHCWLFFAEQSFEQDFLYQKDLQKAHADGALSRVTTVFYADEPGVSLSDRLVDHIEQLVTWIEDGAHLYFCGDKGRLQACESDLGARVDLSIGDGAWKALNKQKRLHRNVY